MINAANKMMIVLTLAVVVVQMWMWYGHLPDPVPSHFDATGNVDGHMGKFGFYILFGVMHAVFLLGFPLLGRFLKRIPDSMINVPNKEYWLAPERRDETLSANVGLLTAIGWMTSWLFIAIFQLSGQVAIEIRSTIAPEIYWLTGIYVVAVVVGVVWMLRRFRVPSEFEPPQAQRG